MRAIQSIFKRTLLTGLMAGLGSQACADTYAPWLTQIGISDRVMSAANWGRGLYLGVVDTGVKSGSSVFASGQVSTALSSCAAVSFKCSNSFQDDNGHGTAVAEIAAGYTKFASASNYGGYKVSAGSVVSVAPDANIIAEKVLNAAGSGYSTDVASGIKKAADAGAAVINVSITYGNTAEMVAAINYAAAKGAMIVWAGGNSAQTLLAGANTNGLTTAAIQRLVFAGSVNAANGLSSFSNTPGSGKLVVNNATQAAYMNRWLMAPGEAILAPYIMGGSNAWAYWSGTSMSAPMVSGALILLESAWPILRTNGTAANLMLATSTDLGAKGVDATFGTGLMSLATAFQPYGALTTTGANGKTYTVSSLTGGLITGGALGSLASVQSKLANYTAFDGYARNFTVNLSSLVTSSKGVASLNPLPTNVNKGPVVVKLNGGNEFAYWQQTLELSPTVNVFGSNQYAQQQQGFAMMRLADGTQLSAGLGYAPQYAHQSALFDSHDVARLSLDLGSTNLHALAQGGLMASLGLPLSGGDRLALSWSATAEPNPLEASLLAQATKLSIGYSHAFNPALNLGVTYTSLQEQQGFLGSVFGSNSMLGLQGNSQSQALEFSGSYKLSRNQLLVAQMSVSATDGVSGNGLLTGVNGMHAQGFGLGWLGKGWLNTEDQVSLTLKQPLRVTTGTMGLWMASVDALGNAVYHTEKVSLVPDGRELDIKLGYDTSLSQQQTLSLQAIYRHDVMHMQGVNDMSIGGVWTKKF
jgi:hypothetical protein